MTELYFKYVAAKSISRSPDHNVRRDSDQWSTTLGKMVGGGKAGENLKMNIKIGSVPTPCKPAIVAMHYKKGDIRGMKKPNGFTSLLRVVTNGISAKLDWNE